MCESGEDNEAGLDCRESRSLYPRQLPESNRHFLVRLVFSICPTGRSTRTHNRRRRLRRKCCGPVSSNYKGFPPFVNN